MIEQLAFDYTPAAAWAWPEPRGGVASGLVDRFAAKTRIDPDSGCVIWTAAIKAHGYGSFVIRKNRRTKTYGAHRLSYELFVGEIPQGLQINHHCDVRACVRPDHLYAGTHLENVRDAVARNRLPRGEHHYRATIVSADVLGIRAAFAAGDHYSEISARFGIPLNIVSLVVRGARWRHVGGPLGRVMPEDRRHAHKLDRSDVAKILAMSAEGVGLKRLARHFGIHQSTVQNVITGRSWTHEAAELPRRAPQAGRKLDADQVRAIRRMHADGATATAIGRHFGVGRKAIGNIVNGRYWRHVE